MEYRIKSSKFSLYVLLLLLTCKLVFALEPAENHTLSPGDLIENLKQGGYIIYIRHASTDHNAKGHSPQPFYYRIQDHPRQQL
jgi:hypothetical protein